MPNLKPLDHVRKYLERAHATNQKNIPNILAAGVIEPCRHALDPRDMPPVVFTSAEGMGHSYFDYSDGGRNSLIHLHVPKDWHRVNVVENPHMIGHKVNKDPDWPFSYDDNRYDRQMYDVMNGGRTTTYREAVPNEFIDRICFGPNADMCYDRDTLLEHIINESPDQRPDMWEWDYTEEFYPEFPEVFKRYGRH